MSKGIIVVNITNACDECSCCQYDGQYDRYCGVNGEDLMNIDWSSEKPNWCPIKPILQKQNNDNLYDEYYDGFDMGWNACIDEILKGE